MTVKSAAVEDACKEADEIIIDERWAHERADELVAAGHPWEEIKLVLQMEAHAVNEVAKLTDDRELADYMFGEYRQVIGRYESRELRREEFESEVRDAEERWMEANQTAERGRG